MPQRPSTKAKGETDSTHKRRVPHSPCAPSGAKYKDEVMRAMIDRLAALEMEDARVGPDVRHAWALAISAVERVRLL